MNGLRRYHLILMSKRAVVVALFLVASCLCAGEVVFKKRCLEDLIGQVPNVLSSQDARTGRFGSGIWIVTDQNVMLALAAAWST